MTALIDIRERLVQRGWFSQPGAYVLVDGAFGSCGKGAVAALLGQLFGDKMDFVTTNAGCNSGHVGYLPENYPTWKLQDGEPTHDVLPSLDARCVKTQQIPVAAVIAKTLFNRYPTAYLNAGAIIDPIILREEAKTYGFTRDNLIVHPNAAIIDYDRRNDDAASTNRVASTSKGVGTALARKVMREESVAKFRLQDFGNFATVQELTINHDKHVTFLESAQGFSLGINQPFYPYTTSRECSVGQALADAAIPFNKVKGVVMAVRTFPIRVGSTSLGYSGDCYPDQREIAWNDIGRPPELTTVTKRVRRLFTWSDMQFIAALRVNQPSVIFVSFLDYLSDAQRGSFIPHVIDLYTDTMGQRPDAVIGGYGPYPTDARLEA